MMEAFQFQESLDSKGKGFKECTQMTRWDKKTMGCCWFQFFFNPILWVGSFLVWSWHRHRIDPSLMVMFATPVYLDMFGVGGLNLAQIIPKFTLSGPGFFWEHKRKEKTVEQLWKLECDLNLFKHLARRGLEFRKPSNIWLPVLQYQTFFDRSSEVLMMNWYLLMEKIHQSWLKC